MITFMALKNVKSALIAAVVLSHIEVPEPKQNSQILSGARSRPKSKAPSSLAHFKSPGLNIPSEKVPKFRQKMAGCTLRIFKIIPIKASHFSTQLR